MSSSHVSRASSSAVNLEVRHNHAPHRQSNMFPPASFPGDTEAKPAGRTFESKPRPVTWLSLPRKGQLFILFLCRLVDFLQVASLQAYMFYQLKSFDIGLPDTTISYQAGVLQGCFTGAQVATAMLWGKAADSSSGGRKLVLLVGLVGTAVSCLGYGFATTFASALWWRAFGGAINGTVGTV
jgi:MFS family permease